jgi:hypothetical protein
MTTRNDTLKHVTTIAQRYDAARAVHEWWFTCSCGATGDKHLSPKQAERSAEEHNGTAAALNWKGPAAGVLLALALASPAAANPITIESYLTTCDACIGYGMADAMLIALRVYPASALFPSSAGVGQLAVAFNGPNGDLQDVPGRATYHPLTFDEFAARQWTDLTMVYHAAGTASVPEPSTALLLGLGLCGLWAARKRRSVTR